MRRLPSLLLVATAAGFACTVEAARSLTRYVPETAPVVLMLRDLQVLRSSAEHSPLYLTWNDPQVQRYVEPLRRKIDWDEIVEKMKSETGYTPEDLWGMVEGDVVFSLTDLQFLSDPSLEGEAKMIFAADFGDNGGKIQGLMAKAFEQMRKEDEQAVQEEKYGEDVIFSIRSKSQESSEEDGGAAETPEDVAAAEAEEEEKAPSTFYVSLRDGVLAVSPSRPAVIELLDALEKGGVESPLERSTRLVQMRERAPNDNFLFLVHFPAIFPAVQEQIAARGGQSNPMGVSPAAVLPALGVDAWGDLYLAGSVSERETVTYYGMTYSDTRGLTKMFGLGEGAFPRPAWVPAQWKTVSSFRFSVKTMFGALEETLRAVSPVIEGMAQGYLTQFNQQLGIDIKRDLFGSFGDEFIQAQFLPENAAAAAAVTATLQVDQLWAFSLDNAPALTRAIEALKAQQGPTVDRVLAKRDYLGQTLYTYTPPVSPTETKPGASQPVGFSYAITDRYLLVSIGSAAPIEGALQSMQREGESFWDRADVKEAIAQVPEGANAFAYQDSAAAAYMMFAMMASFPGETVVDDSGVPRTEKLVNSAEMPSYELLSKYWRSNFGYMMRTSDGVHGLGKYVHPSK